MRPNRLAAVSSLCWRAGAELLAGLEGGTCERWQLGADGGGAGALCQPALETSSGELFAMAPCGLTDEVFLAAGDGRVHRLGVQ